MVKNVNSTGRKLNIFLNFFLYYYSALHCYQLLFQLRHLFTNKYIHVSTTKTSRTESNNMAVSLCVCVCV